MGARLSSAWEAVKGLFAGGSEPGDRYVTRFGALVFGSILLFVGLGLLATIVDLWPTVDESSKKRARHPETAALFFGIKDVSVDKGTGLILLAMFMGALGGFVHAATSFTTYLGNRTLRMSWMWWYWLRIPLGAALALAFYFVLRAGLVNVQGEAEQINAAGTAAFAFLAGLFSKQAIDKLRELFDTLFASDSDGRDDKLDERTAVITKLQPSRLKVDTPARLVIRGQRFRRGARVRLDDRIVKADFQSEEQLRLELGRQELDKPGSVRIAVLNPPPHDSQSNVKLLRVVRES